MTKARVVPTRDPFATLTAGLVVWAKRGDSFLTVTNAIARRIGCAEDGIRVGSHRRDEDPHQQAERGAGSRTTAGTDHLSVRHRQTPGRQHPAERSRIGAPA